MNILAYWKIAAEIILFWYFIYMTLVFVKGSRTEQLLKGLVIIGIVFVLAQQLRLEAINWVLTRLVPISIIALLIIFQPELRRGLARLGQFGRYEGAVESVEEISKACGYLSKKKIGAIIAIEREVGLKPYIESGVMIDSKLTKELIISIFSPKTPLHDGAIVIQHGRLMAAGCLLPLAQEASLAKTIGTRHRAALGLSEETDAVSVVVSEETGAIAIAVGGNMTRDLKEKDLAKFLTGIFARNSRRTGAYIKFLSFLSPKIINKTEE